VAEITGHTDGSITDEWRVRAVVIAEESVACQLGKAEAARVIRAPAGGMSGQKRAKGAEVSRRRFGESGA